MKASRGVGILLGVLAFVSVSMPVSRAVVASERPAVHSSSIEEFHKVSENLYRGGRPEEAGMDYLQSLGVKTIIDLEDTQAAIKAEKAYAKELGLNWISSPMNAGVRPTDKQVDGLMANLQDESLFPIYIHCYHGQDRTGLILGLYRVLAEDWKPSDAYDEMLEYNFHPKYHALDQYFRDRTGYDQ
jgi:tyrosine-protein phosphatase SIW14